MLFLSRVRLTKKEEEDDTFCLIKDGTFFRLFCLTNPALDLSFQSIWIRILT
jgi:hypothetical protein